MEPSCISIIPASGITENSSGKSKGIGIALRSTSGLQTAKEKLKSPSAFAATFSLLVICFTNRTMAWHGATSSDDNVSRDDWLSNLIKEDATGWETLSIIAGEVLGTAILVFIGCTGCVGSLGVIPSTAQIALTFGLAVMIAIQIVGHISGAHINPSITVASVILGKKSLPMGLLYIIAQCIGAMIGYGFLKAITPPQLLYGSSSTAAASFCMTEVNSNLSVFQGVLAEFTATAILVFFACGLWDLRNSRNTDSIPIRFGLCIAVLCLVFIPYTGCSLNPARTLGPAVWNGYWRNHWVFWVAPIAGAIVASLVYRCLFFCKLYDNDSIVHD